jgi:hypothetical protein
VQRWVWSEDIVRFGSAEYHDLLNKTARLAGEESVRALENHHLDLLVSPTERAIQIAAFTIRIKLPAVTVTLGFFPDDKPIEKTRRDLIKVSKSITIMPIGCKSD